MCEIDPERLRRAFVAVGLEITDLTIDEAQAMIADLIAAYARLEAEEIDA